MIVRKEAGTSVSSPHEGLAKGLASLEGEDFMALEADGSIPHIPILPAIPAGRKQRSKKTQRGPQEEGLLAPVLGEAARALHPGFLNINTPPRQSLGITGRANMKKGRGALPHDPSPRPSNMTMTPLSACVKIPSPPESITRPESQDVRRLGDKKEAPLWQGHRQRLKERFLKDPEVVPDYELVELMLYWIYPRQDVKPRAKILLKEHKTLQRIMAYFMTQGTETMRFTGALIQEIARRLLLQDLHEGELLNNPQKVIDYCHLTMSTLPHEQFRIFFLDRTYRLVAEESPSKGTVDQVPLYPREVLKRALELNATSLILAHNHPSGNTTPSKADIDMTTFLKSNLSPFNITLVDHFIVGRKNYFSFRENGLI